MPAYLALALYLLSGALVARALIPDRAPALQVYFGLSIGLVMMMWLPSLMAFPLGFTAVAQYAALAAAAALGALSAALKRPPARPRRDQHPPLALTLSLVMPFALLSLYLLHTHTLRPDALGALHVGQSTYGDLSLHLGIATGLRGAAYPPEYTLLPGTLLGYPFLADAMAATMLVLGAPLREAFIVTGFLMMALVYWGFLIFAYRLTGSAPAAALSFLLFFLSGGLGFCYLVFDPQKLSEIFTGFYMTPTNHLALNLRWVNVICDLMVPQRTLLAGWMMVLPALMMLHELLRTGGRSGSVALGVWAGLMPMVHTHSFLALGLISAGAVLHTLAFGGARRGRLLGSLCRYGLITAALAAPQMILWTLPQTLGGGSMRFQFNWVNGEGERGLIDPYLWFWLKNVGPVYLLMLPAGLAQRRSRAALALGALAVYVVAELFRFQPNTYDNNKLFTVAYMLMAPLCAKYLVDLLRRIASVPLRRLLMGAFALCSVLSALLSIGREVVSDYELFDACEARAARYVDAHTARDATFATGTQHNNAIAALSGRRLVCGTPTFLYFHGVDYRDQQRAARAMMERPQENRALFQRYGVDYVYVSDWERGEFDVDEAALAEACEVFYIDGDVAIYKVPDALN